MRRHAWSVVLLLALGLGATACFPAKTSGPADGGYDGDAHPVPDGVVDLSQDVSPADGGPLGDGDLPADSSGDTAGDASGDLAGDTSSDLAGETSSDTTGDLSVDQSVDLGGCPLPSALQCANSACQSVFDCADLDLVFTGGVLPAGITFSRASVAGYLADDGVWKVAAAGVPRFDHDSQSLELRGLLVEGAGTNLLNWSSLFSNWSEDHAETVNAPHVAPDGGSARTLQPIGATTSHRITAETKDLQGSWVTFSVFVKPLRTDVGFEIYLDIPTVGTIRAVHDLPGEDQRLWSGNGSISTRSRKFQNGWTRLSISHSPGQDLLNGKNINVSLGVSAFDGSDVAGDGLPSFQVWGAQLELSGEPTSYMPTAGAPAVRAADQVEITDGSFLGVEGSLLADLWPMDPWDNAQHDGLQAVLVGDTPGLFQLLVGRLTSFRVGDGVVADAVIDGTAAWSAYAPGRALVRYGGGSWQLLEHGASVDTVTGTPTPAIARWRLGHGAATPFVGHLRRISYWAGQLSANTATTLVTP